MGYHDLIKCAKKARHPLFHKVEFPEHKVDKGEEYHEADDEAGDVAQDGGGGNVAKAVGHVHLEYVNIIHSAQPEPPG